MQPQLEQHTDSAAETVAAVRQSPLLHVKRGDTLEMLDLKKMLIRLRQQDTGLTDDQLKRVIEKVVSGLRDQVSTSEIDDQLAMCASNLAVEHVYYGTLAGRLAFNKYMRSIPQDFGEYLDTAFDQDLISSWYYNTCRKHYRELERLMDSVPLTEFTYFALRTLQSGYLLQHRQPPRTCFEHPKFMYLRVAVQLFRDDLPQVRRFYRALCENGITVASPILFSSGCSEHSLQCASCFVLRVPDDSVVGMYEAVKQIAVLMKNLGGIGLAVSNIRSSGAPVRDFNGRASGVVRYLLVVDAACQQISQGGGKRAGALAAYLEPWHAEIFDFLRMKRVDGNEDTKGRSIFYGLWIPDEFMRRVQENREWSLMCPYYCPGLDDVYGDEFDALYRRYESEGRFVKQVPARELLTEMVKSMIETGNPYIMFKDHVNNKSNHKNVGVIRGSNLCSEICLPFDANEIAVCILGAVVVQRGVRPAVDEREYERAVAVTEEALAGVRENLTAGRPAFDGVEFDEAMFATRHRPHTVYDFATVGENAALLVRALDRIIDTNQYALEQARRSNAMNRPIGVGVQGLANLFAELLLPFDSLEARLLNRLLFEHIYFSALRSSVQLAKEHGPYPRFAGSPMSFGFVQPRMWNAVPLTRRRFDYDQLVLDIMKHGVRNSTLTAIMPTATTAQLWNNNESIEPFTSNVFYRRVLSGQHIVVNQQLMRTLIDQNLWTPSVHERIVRAMGSIQDIDVIPDQVKQVYKTAWELSQRALMDLAIDRAPFVDQSQSLNIWMAEPTMQKLSAMLLYAWRNGLKTACYYLRSKPAFHASKTALAPVNATASSGAAPKPKTCPMSGADDANACQACTL